jgi:hypothetical protein
VKTVPEKNTVTIKQRNFEGILSIKCRKNVEKR